MRHLSRSDVCRSGLGWCVLGWCGLGWCVYADKWLRVAHVGFVTLSLKLHTARHCHLSWPLLKLDSKKTCCCHYFWLAARGVLYAPSPRQHSTYHDRCYTSRRALAGTWNSSMDPPWRIDPTTHRMSRHYYRATFPSWCYLFMYNTHTHTHTHTHI